jgi:cellobiose phosphorylase
LSGSVSWLLRLVVEDLLGARAEIAGLRIRPCLPSEWTICGIRRHFRGATYDIRIRKPAGLCCGQVDLKLDGRTIDGDLLPILPPGAAGVVDCHLR